MSSSSVIFQKIEQIVSLSGEKILALDPIEMVSLNITPSEVYDVATLIVAELDFLRNKIPNSKAPIPAFYPGKQFPSHAVDFLLKR